MSTRGRWAPRPEMTILFMAFAWTAGSKLIVAKRFNPRNLLAAWGQVALPDVAFFTSVVLVFLASYFIPKKKGNVICRSTLVVSLLLFVWAVSNSAWMLSTGIQLQPDIMSILLRNPFELWPIVATHLSHRPALAIVIAVTSIATLAWFGRRLVRPACEMPPRKRIYRWMAAGVVLMLLTWPAQWLCRACSGLGFKGEIVGYSSHFDALVSLFAGPDRSSVPAGNERTVPAAGQRRVTPPAAAQRELPNVVLVLLESISYRVTSLADPTLNTTPNLKRIGREGAEFTLTRVPVARTTKAFWAALTSTMPDMEPDYAEAIPAETPYEGLPSILARSGYRSGFFQMSKGSFECAPGFFSNLAFDWAWFRENLEDRNAHLGYLSGDDTRMIRPAFAWASESRRPFFLMLMTSVSHDPYEVPAWFGRPEETRYGRYLQTVRFTDTVVGEIDRELTRRGIRNNTILCVMGDHGTSFRKADQYGRWIPYEEVIRVPWVLRWPGRIGAGQAIPWPCSQLDITPTLLRLIGFDISAAELEGKDAFLPSDPNRRLYFSSWFKNSPLGFVEGKRKWIWWPHKEILFEYDLGKDPGEANARVLDSPEKEKVVSRLKEWRRHSTRLSMGARHFENRLLFRHWKVFSSGRWALAYYVP